MLDKSPCNYSLDTCFYKSTVSIATVPATRWALLPWQSIWLLTPTDKDPIKCFPYPSPSTGARPWALSKGLTNKPQDLFLDEFLIKQKLTCNPKREMIIVKAGEAAVATWSLVLASHQLWAVVRSSYEHLSEVLASWTRNLWETARSPFRWFWLLCQDYCLLC